MRARRLLLIILGLAALAYLATGWAVVAPGEVAVVRRLGRVVIPVWGPGSHLGWPLGFDRVERVHLEEVRRLVVGQDDGPGARNEPGAGEYLSGDLNLLRAQATVQYRVVDPVAFTLKIDAVGPLLSRAAESSLARALAASAIDATLREGRAAVATAAAHDLDRVARGYGLGIAVLGVSLTDTRPPLEVAPDFASAQSARSDHDRRVNEAKTYAATTDRKARSTAAARLEAAYARADRRVAFARSRAGRFLAMLAEADKSRPLTVRRLYLDALKEMLPRVGRKIVLTPDEPLDLSILGGR